MRVSPRPNFELTGVPGAICAGDTLQLSAGFDSTATDKTLQVLPQESAFAVEGSRSDSLALPDGTGIPYETTIFFTEFSPGQVLTDPNDLENICVNMEHSWARDIEISLTCPNGQSIILHNFGGQTGSQVFLGIPNDNDLFNPIPGSGYDYCWTPAAPNPTWLNYANAQLPFGGTLPAGDDRDRRGQPARSLCPTRTAGSCGRAAARGSDAHCTTDGRGRRDRGNSATRRRQSG